MGEDLERWEEWEVAFFQALIKNLGVIAKAAKEAKVTQAAVNRRLKESERFKDMFDRAIDEINAELEFEAIRRAIEPTEKPVYQRGELVGYIREYDTKHLQWLLERRFPEKYNLALRLESGVGETTKFKLMLGSNEPNEIEEKSGD